MKCPGYEQANSEGVPFCRECATSIIRTCPKCRTAFSATAKSCPACGHPVIVAAGVPSHSLTAYAPPLAENFIVASGVQ
jgi:predicted amidophosphoribosyltransferase